jgi:hypothetical protein
MTIPGTVTKHVKIEVKGDERCKMWEDFAKGMPDKNAPVLVQFDIDAREHEGRWFNSLQAWNISITSW